MMASKSEEFTTRIVEDLRNQLLLEGRNAGPWILWEAWTDHEIGDHVLSGLILEVWEAAESPIRTLGEDRWLSMFEAVGFITDNGEIPDFPVKVWRGAASDDALGFSWTWDFERAVWFAQRSRLYGLKAFVFELVADKEIALAAICGEDGGRGERELIVDPRRLRNLPAPRAVFDGGDD